MPGKAISKPVLQRLMTGRHAGPDNYGNLRTNDQDVSLSLAEVIQRPRSGLLFFGLTCHIMGCV
jgi:hypothetical protein